MQLLITTLGEIDDPRADNARHDLMELLVVAFVAVLCGATGCVEMAAFGRSQIKFFRKHLKLKHGVPSHDTFSTVFRMVDPKALDAAFGKISARIAAALGETGVIAIDGKALKGAHAKGRASECEMMVSAYATGLRMTLATVKAEKRNEVAAALEVLDLIDINGKLVTGDSLHCNRKMAKKIVEKGADYCLSLKGNQDSLLSDARALFGESDAKTPRPTAKAETAGHGRVETRVATVVEAPGIAEHHEFTGLKAFGRIVATRTIDGKTETTERFYVLSRALHPATLLASRREHWAGIENGLHWGLDVAMGEDAARNRMDHGPANIAILRRRARDLVSADNDKGSLQVKLKRAGWDEQYRLKLLRQMR
jgi:predicted transposase YbfD/YdcC